jgi:hypothetical protein
MINTVQKGFFRERGSAGELLGIIQINVNKLKKGSKEGEFRSEKTKQFRSRQRGLIKQWESSPNRAKISWHLSIGI